MGKPHKKRISEFSQRHLYRLKHKSEDSNRYSRLKGSVAFVDASSDLNNSYTDLNEPAKEVTNKSELSDDLQDESATFTVISSDNESGSDILMYNASEDLQCELANWSMENNITHIAVSQLLKTLKKHECLNYLPADARTLLKTNTKINITPVNPGNYVHLGITTTLQKAIQNKHIDHVSLLINVDGIPISNSTSRSLWPIQALIFELPFVPPIVVGIWEGPSKPSNFNEFLQPLVIELNQLQRYGIRIREQNMDVAIRAFICDAPARSSLLGIKGHSAYHGCSKCTQRGECILGRVAYSPRRRRARTDDDFKTKRYANHHNWDTILLELGIGLVTRFPVEYQHLVCLGVMRKLLRMWCKGKRSPYKLSNVSLEALSTRLAQIKLPTEFARQPRRLNELDRWKATEFRSFLLYTGPFVLQSILPLEYYEHFLLLHTSISILVHPINYKVYNSFASESIDKFVAMFPSLYGGYAVSYNVHNLLHLSKDAMLLGPLDSWSTFPFENSLQKIKRLVRAFHHPLEQICRRISEIERLPHKNKAENKILHPHCINYNGPTGSQTCIKQYRKITSKGFTFSLDGTNDVGFTTNMDFIRIINILETPSGIKILAKKFKKVQSAYKAPCDSLGLHIGVTSKNYKKCKEFDLQDIECKAVTFECADAVSVAAFKHGNN